MINFKKYKFYIGVPVEVPLPFFVDVVLPELGEWTDTILQFLETGARLKRAVIKKTFRAEVPGKRYYKPHLGRYSFTVYFDDERIPPLEFELPLMVDLNEAWFSYTSYYQKRRRKTAQRKGVTWVNKLGIRPDGSKQSGEPGRSSFDSDRHDNQL